MRSLLPLLSVLLAATVYAQSQPTAPVDNLPAPGAPPSQPAPAPAPAYAPAPVNPPPPPAYYYPPPPPAYYYPPPPPGAYPQPVPGTHTHDGFYLRFHLGYGYMSLSESWATGSATYTGSGGYGNFALGGALTQNLILYGSLSANSLSVAGGDINVGGIGVGLAYYFDATNLYIGGTIAAAGVWTNPEQGGNSVSLSDGGATFEGHVGKEWWVSPNWGLGFAGQVMYGRLDVKGDPTGKWTATAGALSFSATYN